MPHVVVDVEGNVKEMAEIVLNSYEMLPSLNYAVSPREGRYRASNGFDSLTAFIFNNVITFQDIEIVYRYRSSLVTSAFREFCDLMNGRPFV